MEFIGSVLGGIFIALLVGTALTFGFVLILWFIGLGVAISLFFMLRQWWWRWRFLRTGQVPPPPGMQAKRKPTPPSQIIDAEFEDITDK